MLCCRGTCRRCGASYSFIQGGWVPGHQWWHPAQETTGYRAQETGLPSAAEVVQTDADRDLLLRKAAEDITVIGFGIGIGVSLYAVRKAAQLAKRIVWG